MDSWRPGREELGFKLRGKELERAMEIWATGRSLPCCREDNGPDEVGPMPCQSTEEAPGDVCPVPRMGRDVDCLLELTKTLEPPRQLYRAKHVMAFFVIGDASGLGNGVAVVEQYGVDYESGPWKMQWRKESSNVREAENLTDCIERLSGETTLFEHEVFVMTDNTAFEGAYYKGHSLSEKLNNIIFRLHKAERDGGFILHVLHITGKRMKPLGWMAFPGGTCPKGCWRELIPSLFSRLIRGQRKGPREHRARGSAAGGGPRGEKTGEASPWKRGVCKPCSNSKTWRQKDYGSCPQQQWRQCWSCSVMTGWPTPNGPMCLWHRI